MRRTFFIGILLSIIALVGIVFAYWPMPLQTIAVPFLDGKNQKGTLFLTLPRELRVGDDAEITLQVDYEQGSAPENFDLISRLETGDMLVSPRGEGHVLINPQKSTFFSWHVRSFIEGEANATLWLFEQKPDGEPNLILSRKIVLPSVEFLGISYSLVRILAVFLLAIGIGLMTPNILKKFKKRRYSISEQK